LNIDKLPSGIKRKMYGKRMSTKRKTYPKKRTVTKKVATQVFARKVRAVIQKVAETKNTITYGTEISTGSLTSPTASHLVPVNNITLGTQQFARNGVKIQPKFLNIRGAVHLNAEPTQFCRMLVIEHDVTDDPLSELLENNSGDFAPAATDFSAIYARINTTKFRVLANKVIKMSVALGYYTTQRFNINVKLGGNMYFDTGETIPAKRQISFIWFNRRADNDESVGTTCEMTYNAKFYYQDL